MASTIIVIKLFMTDTNFSGRGEVPVGLKHKWPRLQFTCCTVLASTGHI